ncbi:hypothetical protein H6G81_18475 [Scytonema hofmannii FACHB-248]|uniref:Uncharacterized protein n=1 Tax=Scytonema hofmannii FACHB-248 TaxID=1842502 RepID=A0ABR8GSP8_9CYAN|nr:MULTISPECIES: hypothetical protein [Nostocales]MBD2606461.1 hypothetical protein [Scytonema hofmannii FACHB-248]
MINKLMVKFAATAGTVAVGLAAIAAPALANSWTFVVENAGDAKIQRIEAAEVGSANWRKFSDSAINTGGKITLEWDSSTNNTSCVWKLRAIYADGPSEAASFNFCEETEIVFEN